MPWFADAGLELAGPCVAGLLRSSGERSSRGAVRPGEGGQVLLDGRDVRTLPLGWVRATVGLVPQDPFLFSRTIAENIGLALPNDGKVVDLP